MKILIDLQHPAHLHFFRYVADRLRSEGHVVRMTGRDKDILVQLAKELGLEVDIFGMAGKGTLGLGWELLYRQGRLLRIICEFRPDLMMAIAGTFISPLARLVGIPVYVFYDTEHALMSNLLAYPFSTCIYVPRCYNRSIRWRHQRYNGYHELAYLHPRYFQPNASVLKAAGIKEGELFSIVRFVGWGAAHDVRHSGFDEGRKQAAVHTLERFGPVFISCEGKLPQDLEPYRIRLPVSHVHDLMAYAALIFGESPTMCSEGAVLGVPGIYVNSLSLGYIVEQERDYGLVFHFTPNRQSDAIAKGVEILSHYQRDEWRRRGRKLVEDKIDVTQMLYKVITARPEIYGVT